MDSQDMKAYRKRMAWSQKALAAALGMHWRTIQDYESGKLKVIPRTVELACRALETEYAKSHTERAQPQQT